MNMISSSSAPYLLHGERSGKPRETYGNRFRDALEKEMDRNNISVSAAEIAVNEMDRARKEEALQETSHRKEENNAEKLHEEHGNTYYKT